MLVAHRVIGPFLEAYSVLADELAAARPAGRRERSWSRAAWASPGSGGCRRPLHTPESDLEDYFKNAFQLAENSGLIASDEPDLAERRRAFADELHQIVRRIDDAPPDRRRRRASRS